MSPVRNTILGAMLILIPVLVACGGSDDDPDPTATVVQQPAATATVAVAVPTAIPQAAATEAAAEATNANTMSTGAEVLDRVGAVINPGEAPWGPIAGFDSTWLQVAVDGGGAVVRIDPETNSIAATIDLNVLPITPGPDSPIVSVAIGDEGVWATGWRGASPEAANGVLMWIDPETNEVAESFELPIRPRGIAVDDATGTIWVSSHIDNKVIRVSMDSGEVLAKVEVASPWTIELVPGALWVASDDDYSTLTRIDLASGETGARIFPDAYFVPALTFGSGSLWLTSFSSDVVGEVQRLDPLSGEVIARIPLSGPGDTAIDDHGLWVISSSSSEVALIDPATNQVVARYSGGPPDLWGIAAGYDAIWVSNVIDGTLTRIDP